MVDATDDASAFYERSLGDLENGADFATGPGATPALRPSALYVSTGLDAASVAAGSSSTTEELDQDLVQVGRHAVVSLPSVPRVTACYDAFGRARASVKLRRGRRRFFFFFTFFDIMRTLLAHYRAPLRVHQAGGGSDAPEGTLLFRVGLKRGGCAGFS